MIVNFEDEANFAKLLSKYIKYKVNSGKYICSSNNSNPNKLLDIYYLNFKEKREGKTVYIKKSFKKIINDNFTRFII